MGDKIAESKFIEENTLEEDVLEESTIEDKNSEDNNVEEIAKTKKSKKDKASNREKKDKKSLVKRFSNWYMEHRKLVTGLLCAFSVACWMTAKLGLTKGVLFLGRVGRPEYTDMYMNFRDKYLAVDTNEVMLEFKVILAAAAMVLLVCNLLVPARYESDKCPVACNFIINFTLITLGASMISYGAIMIGLYKILSVTSLVYVLIGVICLLLLPFAAKDFATEHPDKSVERISSYICGIIGVAMIVAMGAGNVKNDMTELRVREEKYHSAYKTKLWVVDQDDLKDTDNRLYLKLHFYNQYNTDGKCYDYKELVEGFHNFHSDDGSSWKVYKDFSDDYFELARTSLFDNYDFTGYAMNDYEQWVQKQLYYDGYCYGFENGQPEIPEEAMAKACQKVDEMFKAEKNIELYDKDIEITVNGNLVVGESPNFSVVCSDNSGAYSAYVYNIARVSFVGSDKYLEVHNYKSQEEFVIKDDSAYLLKLMVASDLRHRFSEDINISVKGIDYKNISIDEELFGYKDESLETERGAFPVYIWVTTGDYDGSYQVIEDLKFDVPQGFCKGDNIEALSGLDVVNPNNPNVVVKDVSWSAHYISEDYEETATFSKEPLMYKLYAPLLSETGYGFSEDTMGSINGKQLPKYYDDLNDFWSGGYISLWVEAGIKVSAYYYRIDIGDSEHGDLQVSYDYAVAGTTITLEPKPARGYKLKEYEVEIDLVNGATFEKWKPVIENNTFVMPAAPIKITPVYEKE